MRMNWIEAMLTAIIGITSGYASAGWFAKRKAKADAKGKEIENEGTETNNFALQVKAINDIIETWRSSYNDLKVTYDLKYETIAEQYNAINEQNIALKDNFLTGSICNVVEKTPSEKSKPCKIG